MVAVVTGTAGFIGSTLARRLLADGETVRGIDCLTGNYDVEQKMANLDGLVGHPRFELCYSDLATADLTTALADADVCYHLAGQASVGGSWGAPFAEYTRNNVRATQRLLEVCAGLGLRKLVYASSSSVYGDSETRPTSESVVPQPVSPYGVTKLAAEHLAHVYMRNRGLPTASLRFFTVYGPGQRPDMAFHRLVMAAVKGRRFVVNGSGLQTRDFTYVDDIVDAVVAAGASDWTGVANVGGGSAITLNDAIATVEELAGPVDIVRGPVAEGDAMHTSADISLARAAFGYLPHMPLRDGLEAMVAWARQTADRQEATLG